MGRPRFLTLTLTLAFALPWSSSGAAGSATLTGSPDTIAWQGRAWTTTDAPEPDTFDLTIDLPGDYWDSRDGGVEIAIRWTSEYNILDLYVVDDSLSTIAQATGFPTSAESLILREPANGVYHVVVVPTAIQVDTGYEGLAQIELDSNKTGELLPDLVPLRPTEFKIAAGALSAVNVAYRQTGGCYPDELAANPSLTRCLRFDSAVSNVGDGPFELRLDASDAATTARVMQDVYSAKGQRMSSTFAGNYTFHATHGHFHYVGFARYELYPISGGEPDWEQGPVAGGRKADFCMIDTRLLWWADGPRGNGARNHHFPQCNAPGGDGAGPTEMRQGIDVGWADVYTWDLPGQYIDISSVTSGDYAVVVTVNPDGLIRELDSSAGSNRAWTLIHLTAAGVEEF